MTTTKISSPKTCYKYVHGNLRIFVFVPFCQGLENFLLGGDVLVFS